MRDPVILVTGATGTVGTHLVPKLIERGVRVRVIARDPEKAKKLGAEVVVGDLARRETLRPAFDGVDKLFVVTNGLNIAELEGNVYDVARGSHVSHIVKISGRHLDAEFMTGQPLAINQNAAEAHLRSIDIPWTIIRPGFFASNFLMFIDRATRTLAIPVGDGRETPTDPEDIAAVGIEALFGKGHEGKIYEITGPQFVSFPDMVARIANATGKPLKQIDLPPEIVLGGLVASGVPETQARGLINYFAAIRAGKIYPPTDTIPQLLGRRARSFDDWVAAHLAELSA